MSALRLEEMSNLRDQIRQHGVSIESMPMPEIKIPSPPPEFRSSTKNLSITASDDAITDDVKVDADADVTQRTTSSSEFGGDASAPSSGGSSALPSPFLPPQSPTSSKLTRFLFSTFLSFVLCSRH